MKKEIAKTVAKVIKHSQGYENIKLLELNNFIDEWYSAKERFIKLFGDKPIYQMEEKVELEVAPKEKRVLLNDFFGEIVNRGFVPSNESCPFTDFLFANDIVGFFTNTVVSIPKGIPQIKKGMKLLKSFKFFFDEQQAREIQDIASRYIQKGKVSGYFCLSVHPLDFLTISENNLNWRSCHALDGEYRTGNLSYMLDSSTVIAYLMTDEKFEVQLRSFPDGIRWNNKKWRLLTYWNEADWSIWLGREYPFSNPELVNILASLKIIRNLGFDNNAIEVGFKKLSLGNSNRSVGTSSTNIYYDGDIFSGKKIIKDVSNGEVIAHYNDLLYSSCYLPRLIINKNKIWKNYISSDEWNDWIGETVLPVTIGSKTRCLECGKRLPWTDRFLCPDCQDRAEDCAIYCSECGRRLYRADDYIIEGEDYFCPDCHQRIFEEMPELEIENPEMIDNFFNSVENATGSTIEVEPARIAMPIAHFDPGQEVTFTANNTQINRNLFDQLLGSFDTMTNGRRTF